MALASSCFIFFLVMPVTLVVNSEGNARSYTPQTPQISGGRVLAPSTNRTIYLYSETERFLQITESGKLRGAVSINSKGTLLEVQSLGIRRRRIKRAGSNTFVAIDKLGRPYVQNQVNPTTETLFREIVHRKVFVAYQNVLHGWLLAIKKNGKLRRGVKQLQNGNVPRSAQFLVIFR